MLRLVYANEGWVLNQPPQNLPGSNLALCSDTVTQKLREDNSRPLCMVLYTICTPASDPKTVSADCQKTELWL